MGITVSACGTCCIDGCDATSLSVRAKGDGATVSDCSCKECSFGVFDAVEQGIGDVCICSTERQNVSSGIAVEGVAGAQVETATRMVSLSAPPRTFTVPAAPLTSMESVPVEPRRVSLPPPPVRVSLPSPPVTDSASLAPVKVSLPSQAEEVVAGGCYQCW